MDLNAYNRAWMNGATESEAVRAGEDAYEAMQREIYATQERAAQELAAYEAMQREIYEYEQRLIAEHEANVEAHRGLDEDGGCDNSGGEA